MEPGPKTTQGMLDFTIIPALVAVGLTYFIHSLKGTPETLYSTMPTMLVALPAFCIWGYKARKNLLLADPEHVEKILENSHSEKQGTF